MIVVSNMVDTFQVSITNYIFQTFVLNGVVRRESDHANLHKLYGRYPKAYTHGLELNSGNPKNNFTSLSLSLRFFFFGSDLISKSQQRMELLGPLNGAL